MIERRPTQNADAERPDEMTAYKRLWIAVLMEQYRAAIRSRAMVSDIEVFQAQRWFGTQNFFLVCDMAGVNGHYILAQVRKQFAERGIKC